MRLGLEKLVQQHRAYQEIRKFIGSEPDAELTMPPRHREPPRLRARARRPGASTSGTRGKAALGPAPVNELVRARRLHGRGVGWVDAHRLASALEARAWLYTDDAALAAVAREFGIAHAA